MGSTLEESQASNIRDNVKKAMIWKVSDQTQHMGLTKGSWRAPV
jgi:hypothetical protein